MSTSNQDSPFSEDELEQYRFLAQKQSRSSLVGGHTSRRKGKSLEFREFTPYQLGDDIRHIDWRASARYRGQGDWLARRFVAEEQFKLVISVDVRPTMMLPGVLTKWQVGVWLAKAISWITLKDENEVVLHHLFGQKDKPHLLQGKRGLKRLRASLKQFQTHAALGEGVNLESIQKHLPPTAVWVIITDLYFGETEAEQLARAIVRAQNGLRWVILLELDSWPYEKADMGTGAYQLSVSELSKNEADIDDTALQTIENRIFAHRQKFLQTSQIDLHGLSQSWVWPAHNRPFDSAAFFRECFGKDLVLRNLFRKDL